MPNKDVFGERRGLRFCVIYKDRNNSKIRLPGFDCRISSSTMLASNAVLLSVAFGSGNRKGRYE